MPPKPNADQTIYDWLCRVTNERIAKALYWVAWLIKPGFFGALLLLICQFAYQHFFPLPTADKTKFSIAVARLDGDTDGKIQTLIIDRLSDINGVEVLGIPRDIPLKGRYPRKLELAGNKKAKRYLKRSGAEILIWGQVLRTNENEPPKLKLFWSTNNDLRKERYAPLKDISLPETFVEHLIQILQLLAVNSATEYYSGLDGSFIPEGLENFIEKVRGLLDAERQNSAWTPVATNLIKEILAYGYSHLAEQSNNNQALEESIRLYHEILSQPLGAYSTWSRAVTNNYLGISLTLLGDRYSDIHLLSDAVKAFKEALDGFTVAGLPREQAQAKQNSAISLFRIGQRQRGTEATEEALRLLREAQPEINQKNEPAVWALNQATMGIVLWSLANKAGDIELFKQSIEASRAALIEFKNTYSDRHWTITSMNLGIALSGMGRMLKDREVILEGFSECRNALSNTSRTQDSPTWAETQNCIGHALLDLGGIDSDLNKLILAREAYNSTLKVWTLKDFPEFWGDTKFMLGQVSLQLGKIESHEKNWQAAIDHFRDALLGRTKKNVSEKWAETQFALGEAILLLSQKQFPPNPLRLKDAIRAFDEAEKIYTKIEFQSAWTKTKIARGCARFGLSLATNEILSMEKAKKEFEEVRLTLDKMPDSAPWADATARLGETMMVLGSFRKDKSQLNEAMNKLNEALTKYKSLGLKEQERRTERSRAELTRILASIEKQ